MPGPLNGLRVIELARILAGPWAGQTLADLGAEVIKVEAPEGDDTRRWGPPFVTRAMARRTPPISTPRTGARRRSPPISAPRKAAPRSARWSADADILIENFKVGGLAKYGLDYASLSALNPG